MTVTFAAAPALAGSFHADYSAPEGCPTRADFVRAIEQRVPDWRHVEGTAERRLALEVRRTGSGYTGRLGFSAEVREVEGTECATVVRALALVAAVSLDPAAAEQAGAAPPAVEPAPPPHPVTPPEPPSSHPPPVRRPILSFGFGASGALLFGPAPSPLYGGAVHVELGDLERRFLLRVAGLRQVAGGEALDVAEADFGLTAAELGGCFRPLRLETLALSGCLVLTGGVLSVETTSGTGLVSTGSSSRFWGSTGGRFGVFAIPLAALELGVEAGMVVPWFEHSYTLENPTETVHETGHIGADLRLGLTVVLP